MASQETIRVDRSPRMAPNISNVIAPTARIISGNAGAMSGNGDSGIGLTGKSSLCAAEGGDGRGEARGAPRSEPRSNHSLPAGGQRGAKGTSAFESNFERCFHWRL